MAEIFKIIPCEDFRNTDKVKFHFIPVLEGVQSIDRVEHKPNAISPSVEGVERPWYMHPNQSDNLIVFTGTRFVELYTKENGKIEELIATPDQISRPDGEVLYDGPAILMWPTNVFHRIKSMEEGSLSVNFAVRTEAFDIKTNFNIYDLDTETGEFKVLREGWKDQVRE